ncbi:MAG: polysaccharide deacetylase family protein [Oscillibacter sp.]|jgi:peptidoglycan/xylan/chitin deacetylase (PgdA/CDA1 family)|nr:polysaccharide deacetylase family protein [Oscillibacter sp.]
MKNLFRIACSVFALALALTVGACAQPTKLIALTFDDGPSPEYTPQILDILEEKNVPATFFLVGKWLPGRSAIVNREVDDGNQIANHTFNHVRLTGLSDAEIRASIADTDDALTNITGLTDFVVRPPMGARSKQVLRDIEEPVILWSVDAAAGKQIWSGELVSRTLSKATDGGIILMHDTTQANVNAVTGIIDGLHDRGYEFVTVDELFRLKGISLKKSVLYQKAVNLDPQAYDEDELSSHWAYSAINDLAGRGIMTGGGSGWKPNCYLTRAQVVAVLWRASGEPAEPMCDFSDVTENAYYAKAVSWAEQDGVAQGFPGKKFEPDTRVTRQQLYVMLARLAQIQGKTGCAAAEPVTYGDDARIASWAQSSVQTIRTMGFSSRNDKELFRPKDWATRAELAEILDWYINL